MKITVYGGTNNRSYSSKEIETCEGLGIFLAKNGFEILTGACGGYPYFVGRGAVTSGGSVIGYTPATTIEDHINIYKFPTDGTTDLVFAEKYFKTESECYLRRSMDMTDYSDIVIALGGSWGTFSELIFSFFSKKKIIIVEEFGGAGQEFLHAYNFFAGRDNNAAVQNGAQIVITKDIETLKEMLLADVK
ncbi:MAG: hypothetical protein LBH47_03350 [Christensenellaceae bacterium]|jgi:predicted Rossmann-fold nucleotide-binding protein|nr:hypothetical protein [Christensenellaceae bacterium]